MWCGVLWCAVLRCGLLSLVCRIVWGGSVLWAHDVRYGVLCFHVVWLVWFVEWCVGCLAGWVVWPLGLFVGCLAGWGMLRGVCTLWCVLWYAVVCSVMSCVWAHM